MSEIKDFSRPRKRIVFAVDGDTFEASPAIPAEILVEFATQYENAVTTEGAAQQYKLMVGILELVLLPSSLASLQSRLKDRERPVDLEQLTEIIEWLMEQYGMRPTQPSSDSSDGQPNPESGTSSTASTPAAELTSQLSLQSVS